VAWPRNSVRTSRLVAGSTDDRPLPALRWWLAALVAIPFLVLALTGLVVSTGTVPVSSQPLSNPAAARWVTAWATSVVPPDTQGADNVGFTDITIRNVLRVTADGQRLRVRISNSYGTQSIAFGQVTVARRTQNADIDASTLRTVTFNGRPAPSVAAGTMALSDPVELSVRRGDTLAVSVYARTTGPVTRHRNAFATSYLANGRHADDIAGFAFSTTTTSAWFLAGVDVTGSSAASAVVALGDSLTDGHKSVVDSYLRWPDQLSERLSEAGLARSVLNAGVGRNMLLSQTLDHPGYGRAGLVRLYRDVFALAGVKDVVVLLGVNDLRHASGDPRRTADRVVEGYQALIDACHRHGVAVTLTTLPPFSSPSDTYSTDSPEEQARRWVNSWIRSASGVDGVVDFDAVLQDPAFPQRLRPEYDSGDGLHLNADGARVMAIAVASVLVSREQAQATGSVTLSR
jgi:lysophospholipase L1-like esterase